MSTAEIDAETARCLKYHREQAERVAEYADHHTAQRLAAG
jgi:hypothetical protein